MHEFPFVLKESIAKNENGSFFNIFLIQLNYPTIAVLKLMFQMHLKSYNLKFITIAAN